jgi:membrane protein implicated in regulation of membrane protease activity
VVLFLVVGTVGLVLLLGGLLFGDVLDGVLDSFDGGSGLTPALGAALAAFGFGSALLTGSLGTGLAALAGLGGATVVGTAAFFLTRALIGPPAAPVRSEDLLGVFGTVVTRIPLSGLGEVVVPQAGSRVKLAARSDEAVPSGTPVYVVEVLSATSVVVQRADFLPGTDLQELQP